MGNHKDICLEGTALIPVNFNPCCDVFAGHVETCAFDLRYEWWEKSQQWVIRIADDAGGGGVRVRFCPHCGHQLK